MTTAKHHINTIHDVAFEPTYLQALPTAAGRNVATFAIAQLSCYIDYMLLVAKQVDICQWQI